MHEWGFYLQRDDVLKAFAHDVHEWGFYLLVLLLIAHVGAALKHHVIDRDDTLVRMLPLLRRRGAAPIPAAEPVAATGAVVAVAAPAPAPAPETNPNGEH